MTMIRINTMQSNDIQNMLDQLASCLQEGEIDQARSLYRTIFTRLLKSMYTQVRGQASPAVMRGLLELEIAIGGEDGDFNDFDSGQIIDLWMRGDVAGHMARRLAQGPHLSVAVDVHAVARWLEPVADEGGSESLASLRFVYAWLRLYAEEAGLLDPAEDVTGARVVSKTTHESVTALPNDGKPYTDPITGMNFVFVPGGTFAMGDTFGDGVEDEKPVHEVTLSAFYMATCPVTQAQWGSLMAENPSNFVGPDHPVERVTLADVMTFIDKLNGVSAGALRFDLPSEAQWEYAARSAGKNQLYAGGQEPETVAWFDADNTGSIAAVGRKAPNGLGIYDMSGNVWEWCRDIYHPQAYRRHGKTDPLCTEGGTDRVIRGGSWHLDAWSARCSRRFRFDPELFGPALGVRLILKVEG